MIDEDKYYESISSDARRYAELLKVDGKYTDVGLVLLKTAAAIEDLQISRDKYIDKLIDIEFVVDSALRPRPYQKDE